MKILCLGDLHGHLPKVRTIDDVIILSGDYMPSQDYQEEWVAFSLRPWLHELSQTALVVGVAGNHDSVFQHNEELARSLSWIYLEDSGVEHQGVRFWGTPWTQQVFRMAFAADSTALETAARKIPESTDVLISHGPPLGIGDMTKEGFHIGSKELRDRIREVQPRLVVCGHVHEAYGVYSLGNTTVVNASIVDERRRPINPPLMVDLTLIERV